MLFQHLFTSEKQVVFENTQAVTLLEKGSTEL